MSTIVMQAEVKGNNLVTKLTKAVKEALNLHEGSKIDVSIDDSKPTNRSRLEEFTEEDILRINQGLKDIEEGRVYPAEEVFARLRKKLDNLKKEQK